MFSKISRYVCTLTYFMLVMPLYFNAFRYMAVIAAERYTGKHLK